MCTRALDTVLPLPPTHNVATNTAPIFLPYFSRAVYRPDLIIWFIVWKIAGSIPEVTGVFN
jgi:hypothetical protein